MVVFLVCLGGYFLLVSGGLWGAAHIVDMAAISIPSMVAIIVGNLGVHRGFGSMDFPIGSIPINGISALMMWEREHIGGIKAMFSLLSKLSLGLLFLASVLLAAFGFMKGQVFKAEKARDLYWQFEIAKASARAQRELERQRQTANAAEHQAQGVILALEQKLTKMEEVNAVLPTAGCGIELERVRLLNKQAGG
ncbi:hypothetical protein BVtw_14150 [Bartonella vinsonii subsp. berkhoffii str. Tweed]|uniref:Uncharacterized protein n=1 Tax=Bartonella vinsonii subsp. berkhoffii str. Tweed TaxID=1094502 RepID=N6UP23_BARVB|nr:hypothetical protein BVtw_14150 [Bartonella vinsonii subsp. berkhoffii str. Tweed]